MAEALFNPSSLTVMIVDDHDPIRKGVKRVLLSMGFGEVIECFDGAEALKTLEKKPVDLLICDLYMRQVSGFQVLEYVRSRDMGSDIPVIVVTGEASKEEIVKVADMGAEDYLLKPFQAPDLEKKVTKTLTAYYSPTPLVKALRKAERLFMGQGFDEALTVFDAALKRDPESARARHGKSLTLEKLGREDEALSLLQEGIQRNHSYYRNYTALADLHIKANRTRDAIEAMRKELEINPKQTNRQITLAKLLLKEGDALGAVEHFRIALTHDPKRLQALMGIGHAFAMAANLEKSHYYFKRVRRYYPENTKALEAAVKVAMQANEPKRAEMFLREERAAHPDRSDAHTMLAMFYLRQDRDDDALSVVGELLQADPENSQGLKMKAAIYMKKSDFQNAANTLHQCAKVAPSAEVFASLGECYLGLVKIPEAMGALHKALSMNRDNLQVVLLMAEAHRRSQQWIKAYYLFRRAILLGANKEKIQNEMRECTQQLAHRRRFRAAS